MGHFVDMATGSAAEEEMQGTMIVPYDPCGRSAPVAAGVAVPDSG